MTFAGSIQQCVEKKRKGEKEKEGHRIGKKRQTRIEKKREHSVITTTDDTDTSKVNDLCVCVSIVCRIEGEIRR